MSSRVTLPKPTVCKALVSLSAPSRVRRLEDWRVVIPTDLHRLSADELLDLTNDIGAKKAELLGAVRDSTPSGPRAQLGMACDWLDAAWNSAENEYQKRQDASMWENDPALAYLAEDVRYQLAILGDRQPIGAVLTFASWLLTGQLWHPNWAVAVQRTMDEYRARLVGAMRSMLVPVVAAENTPEEYNRIYHDSTGEWLFPSAVVPAPAICWDSDAIGSLAVSFLRPWFANHGWVADLKRMQRKGGSVFRENPRTRSQTDKPRRHKRQFR